MEPKTKEWEKQQLKSKNGYAQKYWWTVQGICGVSPEEEKRKVLRLELKSERVMKDESGESMEPMEEKLQ